MISEKRLIDELENWSKLDKEMSEIVMLVIDTLKKMIEKQPRINEWTPVEKAMPKEKERNGELCSDVLIVTVHDYIEDTYYVDNDYTINGKWSIELITGTYKVTAWMPKPERYRGDGK